MHKQTLRELAKFASGLITGDLVAVWWIFAHHLFPVSFLGFSFDQKAAVWGMIFDVVVLAFLVHYAWQFEGSKSSNMRTFHRVAGTVFALVAVLHVARIFFGWSFIVGGWHMPYWLNGVGALVTGFLSYASFHLNKR